MKILVILILCISLSSCSTSNKASIYDKEYVNYINLYKKGFLESNRSPLGETDLKDLDFYKGDVNWKLKCTCEEAKNASPFEMPTYSGVTRTYILYAKARCKYQDKDIILNLYKNIHQPINPLYKNNLFLPFKDHTNGEETYGGGRYINLLITDIQNGNITIDFNKAYNPWCAYSDGFNCPIPPKENHIDMPVNAGERNFKGIYKKTK